MIILGYSGFASDSRLSCDGGSPLSFTGRYFDELFSFRDDEVPFSMFPLGYFGHDASAAVIVDGSVVAAAAEERFTRTKHSLNLAGKTLLPQNSIKYCLDEAGITIDDVDMVAHYCDFSLPVIHKRLELLKPYLSPGDAVKVEEAYRNKYNSMMRSDVVLGQFYKMTKAYPKAFISVPHHKAHAASAFYSSGYSESLFMTLDGSGEIESSLVGVGRGATMEELWRIFLPTSIGTLYLIITVFLGFRSLDDEYKVMGLAAYGDKKRYRDVFEELVVLEGDGRYGTPLLAQKGLKEFLFEKLGKPRSREDSVETRHADIAAALQDAVQRAVIHVLRCARNLTEMSRLCMAGGVALNCSLNGAIARSGLFSDIFVQPAASDDGCSIGAALHTFFAIQDSTKNSSGQKPLDNVFLGPAFSSEEILSILRSYADKVRWYEPENIAESTADELFHGRVVGWFQGRMEFGPRALGNRSILADPRDPGMKDRINAKVKRREQFRPFAPAVLEEVAHVYFDMTGVNSSPYMLFTVPVREEYKPVIPSVTHVDGTARIQTVSPKTNPLFRSLIFNFQKLSGVPVILNTSFNVRNEPIVCTPKDALSCFLSTDIDVLAIGPFMVNRI